MATRTCTRATIDTAPAPLATSAQDERTPDGVAVWWGEIVRIHIDLHAPGGPRRAKSLADAATDGHAPLTIVDPDGSRWQMPSSGAVVVSAALIDLGDPAGRELAHLILRAKRRADEASTANAVLDSYEGGITTLERRQKPVPHGLDGTCFSSGATNRPDLAALDALGVACGINAGDASITIVDRARQVLAGGGRVFFDSGAFSEFTTGIPVDFRRVFARYDRLLQGLDPAASARATLVMPDQVGSQRGSLARLQTWRDQVRNFATVCDVIVPVQRPNPTSPGNGTWTLAEMWHQVTAVVGSDVPIRPALPCKAAACSREEATAFVRAARPRGVHLLGLGLANSEHAAWCASLRAARPGLIVTSDACEVTALVGRGQPITDQQTAIRQAIGDAWVERYGQLSSSDLRLYPGAIPAGLAGDLADALDVRQRLPWLGADPRAAFVAACDRDADPAWIARMRAYGWAGDSAAGLDGKPLSPAAAAAIAAMAHHRGAAAYLLDILGDAAWSTADRVLANGESALVDRAFAAVSRGVAAYRALDDRRAAGATKAAQPLQAEIWGGFDRVR